MEEARMLGGLARLVALDERDRLKEKHDSGVVDWGRRRRAGSRYEAFWRGMTIGLFASPTEAWTYLQGLGLQGLS
jgi:hypothetical protein